MPPTVPPPGLVLTVIIWLLKAWDASPFPWYKWPLWTFMPLLYLILRREVLHTNLIHIQQPEDTQLAKRLKRTTVPLPEDQVPMHRTGDAFGNDREHPGAGAYLAAIGRNMAQVPTKERAPMGGPSPQLVAQRLLARPPPSQDPAGRHGFKPVESMQLNLLAGAWIQAMVHDWQDHLLDTRDQQFNDGAAHGCPLAQFKVPRTKDCAPAGDDGSRYLNTRTGWWDASFLYGQNRKAVQEAREGTGGRLRLPGNMLPIDDDGLCAIGDQHNSWLGVAALQDLFAREHNAIADMLASKYPDYDDQKLYQLARLACVAVVAKIHTIDWTVELLKTPALSAAMNINWGGFLGLGPLALGLIGRKKARNHGVPYALTEEFTAVYRMHPMLPDMLPVEGEDAVQVADVLGAQGNLALKRHGAAKFLQSLARYPAGQLSLFNYPHSLRNLPTTDEEGAYKPGYDLDMAATDIFRDRERGILRFNDFRRQLRMNPYRDWHALTGGNEDAVAALRGVYGDDVEACDLLVGNLAERKIPGFAISETSFHIFILMASRRLEADRFLTEHYKPEVYAPEGLDWIKKTRGIRDVIARHYPALEREMPPGASAFNAYARMPAFDRRTAP